MKPFALCWRTFTGVCTSGTGVCSPCISSRLPAVGLSSAQSGSLKQSPNSNRSAAAFPSSWAIVRCLFAVRAQSIKRVPSPTVALYIGENRQFFRLCLSSLAIFVASLRAVHAKLTSVCRYMQMLGKRARFSRLPINSAALSEASRERSKRKEEADQGLDIFSSVNVITHPPCACYSDAAHLFLLSTYASLSTFYP